MRNTTKCTKVDGWRYTVSVYNLNNDELIKTIYCINTVELDEIYEKYDDDSHDVYVDREWELGSLQ